MTLTNKITEEDVQRIHRTLMNVIEVASDGIYDGDDMDVESKYASYTDALLKINGIINEQFIMLLTGEEE